MPLAPVHRPADPDELARPRHLERRVLLERRAGPRGGAVRATAIFFLRPEADLGGSRRITTRTEARTEVGGR
ncbi:hypothetical protein ACIBVL_12605 [Streptomyces sp. NPDC049687]|uniref:hypothetical protein n=1 Tax=Streptomyces sp. NPDC049687 TaxID=3365596 RepID=UPI00379BE807